MSSRAAASRIMNSEIFLFIGFLQQGKEVMEYWIVGFFKTHYASTPTLQ